MAIKGRISALIRIILAKHSRPVRIKDNRLLIWFDNGSTDTRVGSIIEWLFKTDPIQHRPRKGPGNYLTITGGIPPASE